MTRLKSTPRKHLHRRENPHTSVAAAAQASRASKKAVMAVAKLMLDGVPRIDEQIWLDCRKNGYIATDDTVQHGRLVLSDSDLLVYTGNDLRTVNNSPSREWVAADGLQDFVDGAPKSWSKKATKKGTVPRRHRLILARVDDLVEDFLYYEAEEDIHDAVRKGAISINDIVNRFKEELIRKIQGYE